MKSLSTFSLSTLVCAAVLSSACSSVNMDQYSKTQTGAVLGTLGGAVLGAAVAGKGNRNKGALIGAIGGGLAGAGVGAYMDKQTQDFEKQLAPQIQSGAIELQKNADNSLSVTMTSSTAFDSNSASLKQGFLPTLATIGSIVKRYGKTTLDIEGHTDASGNDKINLPLSEQRALAVQNQLASLGVQPERMSATGYGASRPRGDNKTESGKQLNRRVTIQIVPVVQ